MVSQDSKVDNFAGFLFFFFFDYYKIWSSGRDSVIRLYVKVQSELLLLLFIIIIIYSLRDFHINVDWGSFVGVWVTASPLMSQGLF